MPRAHHSEIRWCTPQAQFVATNTGCEKKKKNDSPFFSDILQRKIKHLVFKPLLLSTPLSCHSSSTHTYRAKSRFFRLFFLYPPPLPVCFFLPLCVCLRLCRSLPPPHHPTTSLLAYVSPVLSRSLPTPPAFLRVCVSSFLPLSVPL